MNHLATLYKFAINLFVFLFGALILTIHSGYSYGPAILTLLSLPLLFIPKTYLLSKEQSLYVLSVVVYTVVLLISVFTDRLFLERELEIPSRLLACLFIFLLLCQYRPSFNAIIYGILIGAFCACSIALYEKFYFHSERVFTLISPTYVIQAGNICMSLGLFCFCVSTYFYQRQAYYRFLLFLLGCAAGILGSLLSGTRGGWIFLPLILIVFFHMSKPVFKQKTKWIGLAVVCIVMLFAALPQTNVKDRLLHAQHDLTSYFNNTNKNTSLGIRLQLWQSAWESFEEKPLLGWGKYGLHESRNEQFKAKQITAYIRDFDSHAHNEYLNELALRGIVGLLALLGVLLVPLYLFKKAFKTHQDAEIKTLAMAGIILILGVIDYCFSQAFLKHNSGTIFYFCLVSILIAFCYPRKKQP